MLVGKEAIDFTAAAVMPDRGIVSSFNLREHIKGKMGVLFFYPLDFTFVCPSELIALHHIGAEFEKRHACVIAISVDSEYSHLAYRNTPVEQGGVGDLAFPMVADLNKSISTHYDVLFNSSVALRATFIIDTKFVVRHQTVNDLPLGRNSEEILRVLDAIACHEESGLVCPINWRKGKESMTPTPDGVAHYLKKFGKDL